MATPPRFGEIAIPFLLASLICGLFAFALLSCGGEGAGSGELRSWSTAISLDNSSTNQFAPDVAVDGNGNAITVWFQSDESGMFHVWATRYVPGQGWGTPGPIETGAAVGTGCRIAMDPNGNAVVTWVQMDSRPDHLSNVWAALYRVGSGWDAPSLIGNDNALIADNPRVAVDGNGYALAVWEQIDVIDSIFIRTLWANRYTPDTGWGAPELIGPKAGGSFAPDVAVDPMGNGIVVWGQQEIGDYRVSERIWSNRYGAGGWEIPSPIEETLAVYVGGADVAMDARGNATAIWQQYDGLNPYRICSNRYEYGKGWGVSERTVSDNTRENFNPGVSVDPGGNAITVWNSTLGPESVWANRYGMVSGWGSPQSIGNDNMIVSDVQVGMDASGNGIVAWTGVWPETVRTNRFVPGAGWGTPEKIDTGDGISMRRLRLAVSPCGDAFAVWEQSVPSPEIRVWVSRYGISSN